MISFMISFLREKCVVSNNHLENVDLKSSANLPPRISELRIHHYHHKNNLCKFKICFKFFYQIINYLRLAWIPFNEETPI